MIRFDEDKLPRGDERRVTMRLNVAQLRLIRDALEEHFRLRLGQCGELAESICAQGVDLTTENPNFAADFDEFIARRTMFKSAMEELLRRIAFAGDPTRVQKTTERQNEIDVWHAIRHWFWEQSPNRADGALDAYPPRQQGAYPPPKIE